MILLYPILCSFLKLINFLTWHVVIKFVHEFTESFAQVLDVRLFWVTRYDQVWIDSWHDFSVRYAGKWIVVYTFPSLNMNFRSWIPMSETNMKECLFVIVVGFWHKTIEIIAHEDSSLICIYIHSHPSTCIYILSVLSTRASLVIQSESS